MPPGTHAGNLELRELTEGSTLYLPVWQRGGLIYTGDYLAVQGDAEISLTALETQRQEVDPHDVYALCSIAVSSG